MTTFMASSRRRRSLSRAAVLAVLLLISAATVYPFVWLLLTSLREGNTVFGGPFIPETFTGEAFAEAWESTNFGQHLWNSVWITSTTVVGVLVFATLAGYAFAKLAFPFKNVVYVALLSTMMMPTTALIIPLYLQLKSFGLLDTSTGLVVLYVAGSAPFAMFLMRAFFETLPDELMHAARIDGASEFAVFVRVMMPLARPGLATVVIFQFLQTWNEFLIANTVLQDTGSLPLQPVLFALVGQYSTDWPVLSAGLVMSIVPIIVVYVRLQRQFVSGLTLGAVKN